MRRSHVIALIAGLTSLSLFGVSAALAGEDPPADDPVVEESTTTTSATSTTTAPTTTTTEDSTTTTTPATTTTVDEAEAREVEETEDEAEAKAEGAQGAKVHPENHGKYVSQAAKDCPPGPEHGACVSQVARSAAGKGPKKPHDQADKADETADVDGE